MRIPIYYDSDLGIDDSLGLGYLLTSETAELVGVGSVHGNVDSTTAARNTLELLALAGRTDVPVAVGAADPLTRPFPGDASHVHGQNGVGDVVLRAQLHEPAPEPVAGDAAEMLIRLSHEHPGALRIAAVGPLTNLAIALERDPTLPSRIESVYVMGGAALAPGNITPVAEANIYHDPEAAQAVVDAEWPLVLVPLDVTMNHRLTQADREALLDSPSAAARAIGEMLGVYQRFYEQVFGIREVALHDPLAVALATGEVTATLAPRARTRIDTTEGPGRGQTICDLRAKYRGYPDPSGHTATVVLELAEPFGPHLRDRLLRLG